MGGAALVRAWRVTWLVLLLAAGGAGAARAEVDAAAADELMQASGLASQFERLGASMRVGILDALARQGLALTEAERARLDSAVASAYDPSALRSTARATLVRELDPDSLDAMRTWLASEAGRAIAHAEQAAGDDDPMARLDAGRAALQACAPERRALIARVGLASRSVDMGASIALGTMLGVRAGAASARPGEASPAEQQLEGLAQAAQPSMQALFVNIVPWLLALQYAPIDDGQLEQYARFLETPAARRVTDALLAAVSRASGEAAHRLGRRLPPTGRGAAGA